MKEAANTDKPLSRDQQWVIWAIAAQKGDQRAYGRLLKDIAVFVRAYTAGSLANSDWAEDIAQDVLLSVHKSLQTYSPEMPFRPWLISIVHFRRADFLRKHYSKHDHRKAPLDEESLGKNYVTEPRHAGEYKDIERALNSLSQKQRTVFEMMKIQGYTAQEVSDQTGMSVSAIKVSVHRTLEKIKGILG